MLLALLLCIALPKTSSAQRVSVVLENVSLAEALKKVSAASGYEFFYNSNVVLKSDKRITASFDGTELKTVLDHVFSGTEFSYRIKDRTIVVVPRPAHAPPTGYTTAAPAQVVTLILADWTPRASFSFFSVTLRFCPSAPEKNGTVSVRAMALLSVSTWVGCW